LYVDCETTGLDCGVHALVQVAGVIEVCGKVEKRFNVLLRPESGQMANKKALDVQGRTLEQIRAFPSAQDGYLELIGIFDGFIDRYKKDDKFLWIGQNPRFDYGFLDAFFNRFKNPYLYAYVDYHLIDIGAVAQALVDAGRIKLVNLKLATIAEAFLVPLVAHDAVQDAEAVYLIYQKMISLLRSPL